MFHDVYMDMPINHYEMAGGWHDDFDRVTVEWEKAVITEYIAEMEYDDVISSCTRSTGSRRQTPGATTP